MSNPKFSKPPMSPEEKEKKAEAFINFVDEPRKSVKQSPAPTKPVKEKVKPVYLRAPESLWNDIQEIMARTGLSMNAICMDLLRPEIKKKLKDLRGE